MLDLRVLTKFLSDMGCRTILPELRRGEIVATCPLHDDHKPSFSMSAKKDGHPWQCFVCGGGTIVELVHRVRGVDYKKAFQIVRTYGDAGQSPAQFLNMPEHPSRRVQINKDLGDPKVMAAYRMRPEGLLYLQHRGCAENNPCFSKLGWDRINKRIVFPWWWEGEFWGISARGVRDDFKGTDVRKKFVPFCPLDSIKSTVVLVEGEMDAIRVAEVRESVCALGSNRLSVQVLKKLVSRGAKNLILFFDFNLGGQRGSIASYETVCENSQGIRVFVAPRRHTGHGGDPASLKRWMIRDILENAVLAEKALSV